MVTFTPVCGGLHRISVYKLLPTLSKVCLAESQTVVTGLPPVGSKVVRGPDYNYHDDYEPITIEKSFDPPRRSESSDKLFSIRVQTIKKKVHLMRWGDNGGWYDVELRADQ